MKEFELITEEDRKEFLKKIEHNFSFDLTFDEIKLIIKKECERIFEISNNEKLIYTAFSILINQGINDVDFSKISEETLRIILKVDDRNVNIDTKEYFLFNKSLHSLKFKLFMEFLQKNKKGKINSSNKIIDLSTTIIHIDNLIKLYEVYEFEYIDCIVISNSIYKLYKNKNYNFNISSISSIYVFGDTKDIDNIDFNETITHIDTKFRFYIGRIEIENKAKFNFENYQILAQNTYTKILSNGSINSRNLLFYLKLVNYIPTNPKNYKGRNYIPTKLEN